MNRNIRLVVACAFFLWTVPVPSQDASSAPNANDLYSMALSASVRQMEKEWGHLNVEGDSRVHTDYRRMPVRYGAEITEGLPTVSGPYNFEFLNDRELIDRFKRLKREFAILEVHPIHSDGERLRIQVSLSWFSYRNGRAQFGLSDWSEVEFNFDCSSRHYLISSVKLGGI